MDFNDKLINWYRQNLRKLPWRETFDPYRIWLSEVILQQTRVDQGLHYYHKFMHRYPSIRDLAEATEDEVLKLWQGLGYYSRARNLHFTARYIHEKLDGRFPDQYKEIIKLKGIGKYTAAAIASFCYDQPYPVIDGNVYRVLSRIFGIDEPIDSTKGKKAFEELANSLIDQDRPGIYNQAIMEFGAKQCVPRQPDCLNCCFRQSCHAFLNRVIDQLPVKSKKIRQRHRYFNYLVIEEDGHVYINKRTGSDIWQGLYEFPVIESEVELTEDALFGSDQWKQFLSGTDYSLLRVSAEYKHLLTHQVIFARFWKLKLHDEQPTRALSGFDRIPAEKIEDYAVPKLIEKYITAEILK